MSLKYTFLAHLPADLRRDAGIIIVQYGVLERDELLKAVYEKYPIYALNILLNKRKYHIWGERKHDGGIQELAKGLTNHYG